MRASELCRWKEGGWKRPKASIQDQGRSLLSGVGGIEGTSIARCSICNATRSHPRSALSSNINIQGRETSEEKKRKRPKKIAENITRPPNAIGIEGCGAPTAIRKWVLAAQCRFGREQKRLTGACSPHWYLARRQALVLFAGLLAGKGIF